MKQRSIFTLLPAIIAIMLFTGCSKSKESLSEDDNGTVQGAGAGTIFYTAKVTMKNSTFNPASVTVMESGSILWVNDDGIVHTVTADDGSFDSGDLQPGASFGWTFTRIGPHPYHCKYHLEMTGVVKCVTK